MKCKYCGIETKSTMCLECAHAAYIASNNEERHNSPCDVLTVRRLLDGNECPYCHYILNFTKKHIDHIIPISRGGTNASDNLCLSCQECNNNKYTMTGDEYRKYLDEHPEIIQSRNRKFAKRILGSRKVIRLTQNGYQVVERSVYDELIKGNNVFQEPEVTPDVKRQLNELSKYKVIVVTTKVTALMARRKNYYECISDGTFEKKNGKWTYVKGKDLLLQQGQSVIYSKKYLKDCDVNIPKVLDSYKIDKDGITMKYHNTESDYEVNINGPYCIIEDFKGFIKNNYRETVFKIRIA